MKRAPAVVECGGKQRATPLWQVVSRLNSYRAVEVIRRSKAVSSLRFATALHDASRFDGPVVYSGQRVFKTHR